MADLIRGNIRQRNKYLVGLRDRYKDLVKTEGGNSENAKNLNKEISNLDKELKAQA